MSQGVVCFDIPKQTFAHTVSLGCDVISDISGDGKETVYIATDGNGVHFLSHKDRKVVRRFFHDVNDKEGIRSISKPDWIIHCIKTDCSVRTLILLSLTLPIYQFVRS